MARFRIKVTENDLEIKETFWSLFSRTLLSFVIFILSLLIYTFPSDQLKDINQYLVFIYAIPLIPFGRVILKINKIITGRQFIFDRRSNDLIFNNRKIDSLLNLTEVQWNIDSAMNHNESYLEVLSSTGSTHRLSTSGQHPNSEHLNLGRQVAKFLGITFVNNNPLEKEVLWGDAKVDQSSINHLEGGY